MSGPTPLLDDQGDATEMIAAAREQGAIRVQIYRRPHGGSGRYRYLTSWPADGFDLADVRARGGGGEYWLKAAGRDGKIIAAETVVIEGAPRPLGETEEEEDEPERARPPRRGEEEPSAAELAGRALRATSELQAEIREALAHLRRDAPAFQQQNPAELFTSIMGAVDRMIAPYRERLQAPTDSSGSRLDDFIRGLELGRQLDGGGRDTLGAIAASLAPGLIESMRQGAGMGAPAGATPNPPPSEDRRTMISESAARAPWAQMVAPVLPQLLTWAEEDRDPGLRAELTLEDIAPGHYRAILAEISRGGFRQELLAGVPALVPHRAWIEDFFTALRELIETELEPDGGPAGRPESGELADQEADPAS